MYSQFHSFGQAPRYPNHYTDQKKAFSSAIFAVKLEYNTVFLQ